LELGTKGQELRGDGGAGVPVVGSDLKPFAEQILRVRERFDQFGHRRDRRIVQALFEATVLAAMDLGNETVVKAEVAKMETWLAAHFPDVLPLTWDLEDDHEQQSKRLVFKTFLNGVPRESVVDMAFLRSGEVEGLRDLLEKLAAQARAPYLVTGDGNERTHQSLEALLEDLQGAGMKGVGIQRYKGLGEMNPEQLWETTLDPNARTLLQVKIGETMEADQMFSVLMGDEVAPRRTFIWNNALSVKNLDF
jgi:DNA gyrase subunit B